MSTLEGAILVNRPGGNALRFDDVVRRLLTQLSFALNPGWLARRGCSRRPWYPAVDKSSERPATVGVRRRLGAGDGLTAIIWPCRGGTV